MKTLMIDNSLCNDLSDKDVRTAELLAYMESLWELGCAYTEMITSNFLLLPPDTDKSKIMLRVTDEEDLLYVNSFPFPYVVLPANLAHLAPQITRPVVVEFYLRGSTAFDVLDMFKNAIDFENVSMIRLVDNFDDDKEKMKKLLSDLHKEYVWSFDICPLNRSARAVSAAISAYYAEAECVTMTFGSRRDSAEVQDFTLSFSQLTGIVPTPDQVLALCRCNALYHLIFGRLPDSDLDAMRNFQIVPHKSVLVDDWNPYRDDNVRHKIAGAALNQKEAYMDEIQKKLIGMQVDRLTAEELQEYIDSFCAKLFKK